MDEIARLAAGGQVVLGAWHVRRHTGTSTARRADATEWLPFALPDGTPIAQRETDRSDLDAVAFGTLVPATWADDPERY